MPITTVALLLQFVFSLLVSSAIIYIVTGLFGEKEGIWTAIQAALVGSFIYVLAYFFLGTGLLAAVVGGIAWLIALGGFYEFGWIKAFIVAFVVWMFATIISIFLPTLTGPL